MEYMGYMVNTYRVPRPSTLTWVAEHRWEEVPRSSDGVAERHFLSTGRT